MRKFIELTKHYRPIGRSALAFMIPIAKSKPRALFSDVCADLYRQANHSGNKTKMAQVTEISRVVFTKKANDVDNDVLTRLEAISTTYFMEKYL